jgi:DNA-binding HxlR family transcriptional regulator
MLLRETKMAHDTKKDKQRAKVYDALGNSKRIALLKTLSEGPMGFAELKKALRLKSSGHLTHHLNKLDDLIKTDNHGKYCLSDKGKDALLAMKPIEKYDEDSRFRDQVGILIRALRSDSPGVQDVAIVQLSLFGPKAVPYLASALSHALDEISNPQYSNYDINSRIETNAEEAVSGIVRVLGIIGAPASVSDVVKALPRLEAFEALAKIGNKKSLLAVLSAMPKWFSEYESRWRY